MTGRRRALLVVAACALGIALLVLTAWPSGGRPEVRSRDLALTSGPSGVRIPYCSSSPAAEARGATRLLVVVHGDQRNACEYARWAEAAAERAGALDDTFVVAPRFVTDDDEGVGSGVDPYWSDDGWKAGARSLDDPHDRPERISSFEVLDRMIRTILGEQPGIEDVIVFGHSAGGQFVQRYAAGTGTRVDRFVVANPSSYLYLHEERWDDDELRRLDDEEVDDCTGFDDYKYGLGDRYAYFEPLDRAEIRSRYRSQRVDYVLGGEDTDTDGGNLDESCEADLQGSSRLQRGQRFVAALREWFGAGISERHRLTVVPGVGHDAEAILADEQVRALLFGVVSDRRGR